jgi:hypothetical protein
LAGVVILNVVDEVVSRRINCSNTRELSGRLSGTRSLVEHYNHRRLHESLQNVTPADVYEGRQVAILDRRARIKRETLARRKQENLTAA